MNAVERAQEMMLVPQSQLPSLALRYCEKMANENGMCGEVFLTAFAVYAQIVENLPCDDPLYAAAPADYRWFDDMRCHGPGRESMGRPQVLPKVS